MGGSQTSNSMLDIRKSGPAFPDLELLVIMWPNKRRHLKNAAGTFGRGSRFCGPVDFERAVPL